VGAGCASPGPTAQPGVPGGLDSSAGRAAAVEAVDVHVRRYFAHWEGVPHLDYEAAVVEHHAAALAAPDRRSFALATMRFLGSLEKGHTDVHDAALVRERGAPLPFTLRFAADEWVVAGSRVPELAPGDVVAAIDDRPFEEFYREARAYLSRSGEFMDDGPGGLIGRLAAVCGVRG
jgi:carboxyl-terminal processing protease